MTVCLAARGSAVVRGHLDRQDAGMQWRAWSVPRKGVRDLRSHQRGHTEHFGLQHEWQVLSPSLRPGPPAI